MIHYIALGSSSEEYLSHLLCGQGWTSFFSRLYPAQVLEEGRKNKKELSPYSAAFDSLFSELTRKYHKTSVPSQKENAVLALVGLINAVPSSYVQSHLEKVQEFHNSVSKEDIIEDWVAFALNQTQAKLALDMLHLPQQVESIVNGLCHQAIESFGKSAD